MSTTPYLGRVDIGMRPRKAVPGSINSEGQTAHYGGPSPWGAGPDRTSSATFRDTTDHARCASIWRAWQAYHMDAKGWNDIAYNSGVCPHGWRLEGRGPGVRSGANGTNDGNARSTATCYIAGDADPITDEAKAAYLDECARMTHARWQHGDWKSTACAGPSIRDWKAQGWVAPAGVPVPGPAPAPVPAPTPAPAPTSEVCDVQLPVLKQGAKSGAVKSLQGLLNTKTGSALATDGDFGPATDRRVRDVQTYCHLTIDGIVGAKTWSVLFL